MRKLLIIGVVALFVFSSCKKERELIDGKRPEERVAAQLDKYKNELINSANGWVAYLGNTTVQGGNYNFYMVFDKENKVSMTADYNSFVANKSLESTYRLKQVMAPSLIFDTYTYLTLLQDPDPTSFSGEYANGYGSDFEFEIRAQVGDTIKLVGKKRNVPLILIKATAAQKAYYTGGAAGENVDDITSIFEENPFLYIDDPADPSKKIQVTASASVRTRSMSLISNNGTDLAFTSSKFSFSENGLRISEPIKLGNLFINGLTLDHTVQKIFLTTQSGVKIEVKESQTPIIPLHLLLGPVYSSVNLPFATNYPGWSADFMARRAEASTAVGTVLVNKLTLETMQFLFNAKSSSLTLNAIVSQAGIPYLATFSYSYTKTANGIFKFTYSSTNGNAELIRPAMAPLLAQRLDVDTFKLDYFFDSTTGQILGQFISIEHPDFTFSGGLL